MKLQNLNPELDGGPISARFKQPLFISDERVAELLTSDMAYQAVADGLRCHAAGDFCQPLKPYVRPRGRAGEYEGGRFICMPGYVGGEIQAVGVKWIASVPRNVDVGLARASGLVVLNDLTTGRPMAILQCETLSARRTAAVAALSVNHLAPNGSKRIAIIGAGPIGKEVLRALSSQCSEIAEFRLHDLRAERAESLATFAKGNFKIAVRVCESAAECVRNANVIIPATTGAKNYLPLAWLTSPWLVVALSLDDCRPEVLLAADKVIVDDFDQSAREEKLLHHLVRDGRFSRDKLYAQLGEIVDGGKLGRKGDERIYVNPMGMAIEDLAVAARVYRAIQD